MSRVIGGSTPSTNALADIPVNYLTLYQSGSDSCPGLPWSVLAGIGKVESDHGRSAAPGVASGMNFAGAAGPMQFGIGGKAGNTWGGAPVRPAAPQVGSGVDGNGDGVADVYDPADAIFAAARYLCRNGAQQGADLPRAIFAYNHADWYVSKVLTFASLYAADQGAGPPSGPAADTAVRFAASQLGKPYLFGAAGEGFYDCSGLMLRAYQAAGVALPRTSREQWFAYAGTRVASPADLLPGDLVFFAHDLGDPATIHHVGIYVGQGQMIDAPHTGAVVRVERAVRGDYFGAVRPTAAASTTTTPASAATTPASTTTTPR